MSQDTIILCAGPPLLRGFGNSFSVSNSMIPVNGKPVLGRILDDLLEKNISSVIIVHQATDFHLSDFLHFAYNERMKISQVPVLSNGNIVDSLRRGLEISRAKQVRVILGDTLISDSFSRKEHDYLFIHQVKNSSRWALAYTDKEGYIHSIADKKDNTPSPYFAICGYYYFSDAENLKKAIALVSQKYNSEISDVLVQYSNTNKIKTIEAENWYDFGNIDTYFTSKAKLLTGRYFNKLEVDPVLNTVTKESLFNEKLENELNWYLTIPEELKVLTPRIIHQKIQDKKVIIKQEYYGYPTLAEIFVFYNLHQDVWSFILNNLFQIHERIKAFKGSVDKECFNLIYSVKTEERIAELCTDPYWKNLSQIEQIQLNGKPLNNFLSFKGNIVQEVDKLSETGETTIIHGDFCFSNILFDLNSQISRLIDPRGSFGKPGIYGDPRYDVAKLRHSIVGLYDFIMADLFDLKEINPGEFELKIYKQEGIEKIGQEFDKLLQEKGYSLKEIKLIESLLFLSMLPLHKEKPLRQKALFLRGISLLNQIFPSQIETYEDSYRS